MNATINYKLALLWLLSIVGMILHFNYHIAEMIYGVDIVKHDANGQIPIGLLVVRNVFYHLPILGIIVIMYNRKVWINLMLFVISIVYSISHLFHLAGELSKPERDYSQLSLLTIVAFISVLIVIEHFKHWKQSKSGRYASVA